MDKFTITKEDLPKLPAWCDKDNKSNFCKWQREHWYPRFREVVKDFFQHPENYPTLMVDLKSHYEKYPKSLEEKLYQTKYYTDYFISLAIGKPSFDLDKKIKDHPENLTYRQALDGLCHKVADEVDNLRVR